MYQFVIYFDNVYPIVSSVPSKSDGFVKVKFGAPLYGTANIPAENCFQTEKGARESLEIRHQKRLQEHKASITNIVQLLQFPMHTCISGEDQDEIARQAYYERAKELLGIEIN